MNCFYFYKKYILVSCADRKSDLKKKKKKYPEEKTGKMKPIYFEKKKISIN